MITNNSIKEYYTKLHGMYIQCYDMIKAMTQSLSTRDSQISLVVTNPQGERETLRIPSFLYLDNKIEQLDSSLSSLIELPNSGEAWLESTNDLYKIKMVKNGISPSTPKLESSNPIALFKDNNFLKDLVSPKTYLKVNVPNMSDIISSMMMKKIVIYDYDMYNALSGYSSYEDIKAALYGYVKGNDYEEYDSEIDIPIKQERYKSAFRIESIPTKEELGNDNPHAVSVGSKLSYILYLDTFEYFNPEDSTISYQLKAGDFLCMKGQSTTWKVKNVDYSNMHIEIEETSGHTALQTTEENADMVFSIYNNNYSDYHYVEVPLEENQYIIVFLSAISNNTRSSWSTPLFCDLNSIYVKDAGGNFVQDEYGNNLSYLKYYKKYCTNIGDLILGITNTAYPQISNFTMSQLESLQDSDDMQIAVSNTFDTENILQVVPINKHLVDDPSNEEIKSLHASKNDFQQQISAKQSEINEVTNKLMTTDFSKEITVTQNSLKTQLNSLYTEKTHLQSQLNSIVDEINIKSTDLDVTGNEVKYRVRGVTDVKYLSQLVSSIGNGIDVEIIGCDVEYKYKSTNKENNQLISIDSSTFTDWNRLDNIDRQRKLVFDNSVGVEFVDYSTTDNIIKWNQIDIPIQQGEDVIIRLRYKLNIGQPFISIYTPWSDEKTVVFPSQYKSNIDLTTILTENDKDTVTSSFSKTLIDDGYTEHIQDKVISSDQTFFHTPENIYSGFNTPENKMISLKDKLNDINNNVEKWKTLIDNESNSKFEVYLTYDDYSILLSPNTKNSVNIYNINHISDIFIKKNMNIVIKNTGNVRLNLYSIFPGNTNTPLINCNVDSYNSNLANFERVPMLVNNKISAQYLGQWIYFRENSAWNGSSIYFSTTEQNSKDEANVSNGDKLEYQITPSNYIGINNRQVLLGYRPRQGSLHSSTISTSSVKWKGLAFDNINSKEGVDYTKLLEYASKLNDLSTTENKTTDSIYVDIIKTDSSWYNYGLSNDNNWLMRYEDIVKVSSNNENANYEYLTNNTTFRSFISSGGSIKNFSSQNSFVGGFVYPSLLSLDTILTSGEDKASKYIEVGESLSIPIEFEYYTNSNNNSIVKSLYFDLRNSLIRDPYHYMIEFTGNYDMSSENIDTSSNSYNAFTDEVISMK